MALRTVGVKLQAEVSGYMAGMRQASTATKGLTAEMDKAARGGQLDQVADAATMMGAGLVAGFGVAINQFAKFEKQMSSVQAATQASAQEMELLRTAAMQAGKDTAFSATEAGQAVEELAKAGVETGDILRGGLAGALDLAAAGQLDVAEAAETAASAMTQFKLSGSQVPHIADLLAAAAGKAQGSVHDMGYALSQSGLVAAQMGLTIEDTVGTLASFASAGLLGSDAGTSLKTALLMLANPTDKAADLMKDLGIQTYDASGNFVGITSLAGQLKTQLGQLTQEQRNSALATIFGSDAIRAAAILYEQGAQGMGEWIAKVDDQGYAAETARLKTDNLIGDLERLRGELDNLAIQAGEGSAGGLRWLAQAAEATVASFGSLPPAVSGTALALTGLAGGVLLLGGGWVKARRSNQEMLAELRATGPAGRQAARGLESAQRGATRAAAAFVALQLAGAAISSMQTELKPQVEALGKGLAVWGQSGNLAGESARVLGDDMGHLATGLKYLADTDNSRRQWTRRLQDGLETLVPGLDGTNRSLARTRERVDAMDQALAGLVQQGQVDQAKAAFDRLAAAAAAQGVSVEELKRIFPAYAGALEVAGSAAGKATGPTGELAGATDGLTAETKEYTTAAEAAAAASRGQRDALVDLAAKMRAETDPVFGLLEAQRDLTEAQKAAAKAVKEHGRNSDEAREATRKLAVAAIALQGAAGEVGTTFDGKMTPAMRQTLRAAGLTRAQIEDVERQFRAARREAERYDGHYKANVSAPGADKAKDQLRDGKKAADAFDGKYKAAIDVVGYPVALDRLKRLSTYQQALKKGTIPAGFQGPVQGRDYHAGGWTGPGSKYEPAGVVHADEYVIKKESRQRIEQRHPGLLDEMNATGQLRGYADGGLAWRYPTTVRKTRIPSRSEVASVVRPDFGAWPASPSAQRGDSEVWGGIARAIRATGPMSGSFGNGYRPGDPLWHGSGRAVDWMGYNQDALATWLASWRPLELIHRTATRDYAYTRGVNKGSFNSALMEAHRNHIHIAMADGGVIREPVVGVGLSSGNSYSLGERGPETVVPGVGAMAGGRTVVEHVHRHHIVVEGTGLLRNLREEIEDAGGDVQGYLGRKKR
ncbi:phage tail tape measure protein [Micromonospora sp. DT229]|uniref:phage tail tape measure protein n=1 Tax=Micromonospora sp. DT229 TaxID=3393430 RepID=UPI003CEE0829